MRLSGASSQPSAAAGTICPVLSSATSPSLSRRSSAQRAGSAGPVGSKRGSSCPTTQASDVRAGVATGAHEATRRAAPRTGAAAKERRSRARVTMGDGV